LAPLRNHLGLAHGADKEYIEFKNKNKNKNIYLSSSGHTWL